LLKKKEAVVVEAAAGLKRYRSLRNKKGGRKRELGKKKVLISLQENGVTSAR